MDKQTIIRACIKELRLEDKPVTVDNVIVQSLFQSGGTLGPLDEALIQDEFWAIRSRISARAEREYPQAGFVTGLAVGVAINAYFNYKAV